MNFQKMKDAELILELKSLVQKEREILSQVLEYLQEVELRKIHLAKGYPTLFEFATRELGYTAASAQRRIESMRLMKSIPEVSTLIESGALSLSVAAQTQSFFRQENKRRLEVHEEKLSVNSQREILQSVKGLSSRDCERKLAELSPEAILPKEKTCALKDKKTLIQFTADEELMKKLERLKELLSHKQIDNRYDNLFNELADLALKKLEQKPAVKTLPTKKPASEMKKPSRYIPTEVRRAVLQRDAGQCVHKDPQTGHVCGSKYHLQFDHLKPFAWKGESSAENLTLRCRNHNLYRAEQMGLGR